MAREPCPASYLEFSNACYRFGTHSSYSDAIQVCEADEARLVDVDPRNNKYIKDKVKLGGGNDFWIGSYIKGNKVISRTGTKCPMMKGQNTGSGFFAEVNCNSAYPYICQKYGGTQFGNGGQHGFENFDPGLANFNPDAGELEVPVSTTPDHNTLSTTAAAEESSNTPVIAAVVSIVVLVVLFIVIRYMCKRQSSRAKKEKIREFQRSQSKVPGTETTLSRKNTLNKPFSLPGNGHTTPTQSIGRRTSIHDDVPKKSPPAQDMSWGYHGRSSQSHKSDKESEHYHHRRPRSKSRERYLHGVHDHSPPPPYGHLSRHHRSRSRRRSMSRRGSMTDLATTRYEESSRSSSADSRYSDSALSRATGTTRFSRRGRESRRSDRHYHRDSPSRHYHEDRDRHYESRSDRRRRSYRAHSHHKPRSMYEQYAVGKPPSPALDVMSRQRPGSDFRDRESYYRRSMTLRGGDGRFDSDLKQSRLPDSSSPIYFPQMTNAWSREDLRSAAEHGRDQHPHYTPQRQSRAPRQGPIRVNRHIHDFDEGGGNPDEARRIPSKESDHIYESLDEFAKGKSGQDRSRNETPVQAISLHERRSPYANDSGFSRGHHRSSARSRASLHSRDLPAIPLS